MYEDSLHSRFTSLKPSLSNAASSEASPEGVAFFLSSKSEGLPLCLLEGLAAAKPAVAMNVGGVGEVLDEGVWFPDRAREL
jgi:glycosyltransferase involved in cell wall biosynthesis